MGISEQLEDRLGFFPKHQLANKIAIKMYASQGYAWSDSSKFMCDSPHPTERLMYEMAMESIDTIIDHFGEGEDYEP